MNTGRASRTAMMVTYLRALADAGATHVPGFCDPTARVFLNARWSRRLTKIRSQLRSGRETASLAFARVAADMVALRTAVIDAAVRDAVAAGVRQVVILGAGLDGRAWRMKDLDGTRVFEVDHPATQTVKRHFLGALPPPIASVTFVPIDFEREALSAVLASARQDDASPTCWIWEGVVMYLTRDVVRATLAGIASRSAVGSILIVNYHTTMRHWLIRLVMRLVGEPVRSKSSPQEMAADLGAAGFEIVSDSGGEDWATRFASGPVDLRVGRIMRVAVAKTVRQAPTRYGTARS